MPISKATRRALVCLALPLLVLLATTTRLAADLVWTPQTGWKVEGGLLSGLVGPTARTALEAMNQARSLEEAGDDFKAIDIYLDIGKKYSSSIYAPEALYRAATLLFENRRFDKAFDTYQNVITRYPNTPRFDEIIGQQYRIAAARLNGVRGSFLWIFPGFTNRDKGIQEFETIVTNAPYSDYAPLSLMNIAAGHNQLGNSTDALYALDRLINNYNHSILTPDAYIQIAKAYAGIAGGPYYDQGSTKQAITYYEDFLILYPNDPHSAEAEKGLNDMKNNMAQGQMRIADFYFRKRANYKAARVFYNDAITLYPDSDVAALARKRLVEVDAAAAKAAAAPTEKKKKHFLFF